MRTRIKEMGYFPVMLLCMDLMLWFVVWLLRPKALKSVGIFLALFSVLFLAAAFLLEQRRRTKISQALERFVENPNERQLEELLQSGGLSFAHGINGLYQKLTHQEAQIREQTMELASYREFIEAWVHEMKTPISLSTLVLENRKEEMSAAVYQRMVYVQQQLTQNVERILYYARLQMEHKEYKFTQIPLDRAVQEVAEEYQMLAAEKKLSFHLEHLQALTVNSDEKVLHFMLSQLFDNACKYADPTNGSIEVKSWQEQKKVFLAIRNNGTGVPPEDAPFLFDRGFTGNQPDRQKATGMGLYLVKKYAEALCIEVQLEPVLSAGFGIVLIFSL